MDIGANTLEAIKWICGAAVLCVLAWQMYK